jgi:hypothetical protein
MGMSAMIQACHRKIGAVAPQNIDPDWHFKLGEINVVAILNRPSLTATLLKILDGSGQSYGCTAHG